jgi:hypothetical protein
MLAMTMAVLLQRQPRRRKPRRRRRSAVGITEHATRLQLLFGASPTAG